jgi:hypothetical protein
MLSKQKKILWSWNVCIHMVGLHNGALIWVGCLGHVSSFTISKEGQWIMEWSGVSSMVILDLAIHINNVMHLYLLFIYLICLLAQIMLVSFASM